LRDTVESALKLAALIFARDLIEHGDADAVRRVLFAKPLTLGDWNQAASNFADMTARTESATTQAFAQAFNDRRRAEICNEFVRTRNQEIGHGAFRVDPMERAALLESLLFDPRTGVAGLFARFAQMPWPELFVLGEAGPESLAGAEAIRRWHELAGPHADHTVAPLPCIVRTDRGELLLSSYVMARRCAKCTHQDVFLFDGSMMRGSGAGKRFRFDFIDYVQGHRFRDNDADLSEEVAGQQEALEAAWIETMNHGVHDRTVVDELDSAIDQVTRYVTPHHLRDPLSARIGAAGGGTVTWLQAPAHTGKSVFARAIADARGENHEPLGVPGLITLGVFVQRFWRADFDLFTGRLRSELVRAFDLNPDIAWQQLPGLDLNAKNPPAALVALISAARAMNSPGDRPVLLVIDGLDELSPAPQSLRLLDFIPRAEDLPTWLHVVVSSRRPQDTDCPAWIDGRLSRRLAAGCTVQRLDLDDAGYRQVLRDYAELILKNGQRLSDRDFDAVLQKAGGLFLFVSFIVEQIALGRLRVEDIGQLGSGQALFRDFIDGLRSDLGHRRLVADAEDILLALAAEERAHAWQIGPGLELAKTLEAGLRAQFPMGPEPTAAGEGLGDPLLTDDPDWSGLTLERLARYLDRDTHERAGGSAAGLDSNFLYAVFRLKAALGVTRGGSGAALFRLWLKDLAGIIADDPHLGPRLSAQHARAARVLLDGETGEARAFAHAVLSGAADLLERARDGDELLEAASKQGVEQSRDVLDHARAIRSFNGAITIIAARSRDAGGITGTSLTILANTYVNRAVAKRQGIGPAEAIPDYDAGIALMEGLRDMLTKQGDGWPPEIQNHLAAAYMNRGVAKTRAVGPAEAISDYDDAIALREDLRDALAAQGQPWPPDFQNSLAATYMNRAVAKGDAFGEVQAIPDYDAAITLMEGIRGSLAEEVQPWPSIFQNALATAYMNRGVAKVQAIGPAEAIPDYDAAIALREGLRDALTEQGQAWLPAFQNDLATAYVNRANAKSTAFGEAEAIPDYDAAIALMEGLRDTLAELGLAWPPDFQNDLAAAYTNRAIAKRHAISPAEAITDYDAAIALREGLRDALTERRLAWPPAFQNDLAATYTNRAIAKRHAIGPAEAIADYDAAITLMEGLRDALAEQRLAWPPAFQDDLATAYTNRAFAKHQAGDPAAVTDAATAHDLASSLVAQFATACPPDWVNTADRAAALVQALGGNANNDADTDVPDALVDTALADTRFQSALANALSRAGIPDLATLSPEDKREAARQLLRAIRAAADAEPSERSGISVDPEALGLDGAQVREIFEKAQEAAGGNAAKFIATLRAELTAAGADGEAIDALIGQIEGAIEGGQS